MVGPPLAVIPVREEARRQLVRIYLPKETLESQENGKQQLQEDEGNYDSENTNSPHAK